MSATGSTGSTGSMESAEPADPIESTESSESSGGDASPTETGPAETGVTEQKPEPPGDRLRSLLRRRRHAVAVGLLTLMTTAFYAAYLVTRFKSLDYGLLDLGIYDQAVREYSHFHAPHSPVVALPSADSPGLSQLSDHFTPILALIAPLYWIHDSPVTLLIAGGALIA